MSYSRMQLLILFLLLMVPSALSAAGSLERDKFMAEYRAQLANYRSLYEKSQGLIRYRIVRDQKTDAEFYESGSILFERDGKDKVVEARGEILDGARRIQYEQARLSVDGKVYCFRRGEKDERLMLKDRYPERVEPFDRFQMEFVAGLVDPHVSLLAFSIGSLLDSPAFAVSDVTSVSAGVGNLLKFSFTYSFVHPDTGGTMHARGWWTVSRDDFAVRELTFTFESPRTEWRVTNEFEPDANGRLIPVRKRVSATPSVAGGVDNYEYAYERFSFAPVPRDRFRLSRFGLPDDVPPAGGGFWGRLLHLPYLFVGLAVILAILAFQLRRRGPASA